MMDSRTAHKFSSPHILRAVSRVVFPGVLALLLVAVFTLHGALAQEADATDDPHAARDGQVPGAPPGGALGTTSDADMWRMLRQGGVGDVSIPDLGAGTLIQSEGEDWRETRTQTLPTYGGLAIVAMLFLLSLFFAVRGRIRIEKGRSGITITRFSTLERSAHWLLASSFIVLALTGLNITYGRELLIPLLGHEAFAVIATGGKLIHNHVAFAFMVALVVVLVIWIRDNIPNRHDLVWLLKGGGMLTGEHPPSKKFNAGQKIVFWLVMLLGLSVSLSGWSLIFPFTTSFFSETNGIINSVLDTGLPTDLTAMQEQQWSQIWHGIISFAFVLLIIAHIYIGTLGMEGAFDAMGKGEVDLNWAREHHSLWVEEIERKESATAEPDTRPAGQPAE